MHLNDVIISQFLWVFWYLFGGCFFFILFLFDSVESSNIVKHFSGSLIDPLLPNCLLFHFFFVKMTQGFLFCCFQKNKRCCFTTLHLFLHQDDSIHHKFHKSLGRGGEGKMGVLGVGSMVTCQESSLHSWRSFQNPPRSNRSVRSIELTDLLISSAGLSCLCPELPKDFWT